MKEEEEINLDPSTTPLFILFPALSEREEDDMSFEKRISPLLTIRQA